MSDEQGGLEERSRIPLSFSVHPEEGCHSILAPQIRGYELLQKIGEGGMGSVWRAQENNTKRQVAVKVLKFAGSIHGPARARFRREIELAANLVHPHIVRLYDPGSDNGVIYYTMELIKGQHLDEYVRHHELSRHQITELMLSISQAVQYAHQCGVIHRDLKPSNILVSEDGQPHIVDFGLAKALLEENDKPDLTITRTGDFAGTLAFMAPEQASGDGSLVDTRTDVYALGVICYKLLTNRYPHQLSRAPHVAQRQIMEQDVCRPRVADPAIDSDLEALLLKALAKDPNDRYGSAGELANDLENYLKGEPLTARRFTLAYYLRKRMRRYRVQIAVASAALIGVYLLAVTGYPRIKDLARKEVLVTEIAEGFVDKLAPVEGMGLIPTYSASPLDPDYKIYGRRFSAYDNAVATIALVMSGHFEEAEQILDGLERFPI